MFTRNISWEIAYDILSLDLNVSLESPGLGRFLPHSEAETRMRVKFCLFWDKDSLIFESR